MVDRSKEKMSDTRQAAIVVGGGFVIFFMLHLWTQIDRLTDAVQGIEATMPAAVVQNTEEPFFIIEGGPTSRRIKRCEIRKQYPNANDAMLPVNSPGRAVMVEDLHCVGLNTPTP